MDISNRPKNARRDKELVSYAQNCEDILLWRALGEISEGFYIDIGANDPNSDSVTRLFYEAGWSGINVEPVNQWLDILEKERPRDINLKVLTGAGESVTRFFEVVEDTRLSTTKRDIAEQHQRELGYHINEYEVACTTLSAICEQHVRKPIQFLKIDVEGGERAVLDGLDLTRVRPWIIVIESTLPCSSEENYSDWEHLVLGADYSFVFFDGLSRYYVAKEHPELKKHFTSPANIQDSFITAHAVQIREKIYHLEALVGSHAKTITHYEEAITHHEGTIAQCQGRITECEAEIREYRESLSWKLTKPLRSVVKLLGKSKQG